MTNSSVDIKIVPAEEKDVPVIMDLVLELAEYEKMRDEVDATVETMTKAMFGDHRVAYACLLYYKDQLAGHCIYFYNFSTFVGKPGIYIEDIYIRPEFRRKSIGKAVFIHLGKLAKEKDCGRIEWAVLDWNQPAIDFYEEMGAAPMPEWKLYRISGKRLDELAEM